MANEAFEMMRFSVVFSLSIISSFSFGFCRAQMVPAMFVFGDSLVDVGNNNYLSVSTAKANFPHNGVDFPTKKPTGRFCNGKNAADFLAEKVGLPSSPPYLSVKSKNGSAFMTGVSFASGGAGIFNGTDQSLRQSIPLTKQVGYFEIVHGQLVRTLGSSAAQSLTSKSLYAVVVGSNDLFDYSSKDSLQKKYTPQQYADSMALALEALLKRVYNAGARKFVFAGVGPLGCTPSYRSRNDSEECNTQINSLAVLYDNRLKSTLQGLKSSLNGFSYSFFDTYAVLNNIIQHPSNNGFAEVKSACCGLGKLKAKVPCVPISTYCSNRKDHVFWDLFHPTEATASILVDTIFDGPTQYSFPMNLRQLLKA